MEIANSERGVAVGEGKDASKFSGRGAEDDGRGCDENTGEDKSISTAGVGKEKEEGEKGEEGEGFTCVSSAKLVNGEEKVSSNQGWSGEYGSWREEEESARAPDEEEGASAGEGVKERSCEAVFEEGGGVIVGRSGAASEGSSSCDTDMDSGGLGGGRETSGVSREDGGGTGAGEGEEEEVLATSEGSETLALSESTLSSLDRSKDVGLHCEEDRGRTVGGRKVDEGFCC